ncbi:MAG: hypothetical protein ACKPJQ_05725, partial [Dolichospermum sp.]
NEIENLPKKLYTLMTFNSVSRSLFPAISCYAAKLYNPNIARCCGAGIRPPIIIQNKFTTA